MRALQLVTRGRAPGHRRLEMLTDGLWSGRRPVLHQVTTLEVWQTDAWLRAAAGRGFVPSRIRIVAAGLRIRVHSSPLLLRGLWVTPDDRRLRTSSSDRSRIVVLPASDPEATVIIVTLRADPHANVAVGRDPARLAVSSSEGVRIRTETS